MANEIDQACGTACTLLSYTGIAILVCVIIFSLALLTNIPDEPCRHQDFLFECVIKTGLFRVLILAGITLGLWNVFFMCSLIWNRCRRG
jgi:hypothetical protein